MSLSEVRDMTYEDSEMLLRAMSAIRSEEFLFGLQQSSYPQLKKHSRDSLWKSHQKLSKPRFLDDEYEKPKTTKDLAKLLSRSLSGG